MARQIAPVLTSTGQAEQAMTSSTSLFDDGRIVDVALVGAEGPGAPS
jgi:predicted 3-demethylubiquinone-9 3-methyltransferase (glyoxalase superfamily)